jgi:hypothetical protein
VERQHCPNCGNEVFFDSMRCVRCDTQLTYEVRPDGRLVTGDVEVTGACSQREFWRCNWTPAGPSPSMCASCRLVDAGDHTSSALLIPFLAAQRRALWQLAELDIAWLGDESLRFVYRSRAAGDEASIGHRAGLITLDLDEADPARGEQIRSTLGEHYRTPLGHLRHELGHYVWLRYVANDPARLATFRETFGDERTDYQAAIDAHYAGSDDGSWRAEHVSYYASAHPWEDFAESWAQVMHIHDVVSTGVAWGVIPPPATALDRTSYDPRTFDPAAWVSAAITASLAANELARAMGMRDLYPFALSAGARRRIEACWLLVHPPAH